MTDQDPHSSTPSPRRTTKAPSPQKSDPGAAERLAAALRENLKRRKEQARGRKTGEDPQG